MSSDVFYARIGKVEGSTVAIDDLAGFDYVDEVAKTPSFAIKLLFFIASVDVVERRNLVVTDPRWTAHLEPGLEFGDDSVRRLSL